MLSASVDLDLNDTEVAFRSQTTMDLRKARLLFKAFGIRVLVELGPKLVSTALKLRLPIASLIKMTIYQQFCGGESIADSMSTISRLEQYKVGSILDYSVEGLGSEQAFDDSYAEVLRTIVQAAQRPSMRFAVFKVTAIGRFELLAKVHRGEQLTKDEKAEYRRIEARAEKLCEAAAHHGIKIMIDAEETWIQDPIDIMALNMMRRFNSQKAIVYNTVQLYRVDRLNYLKTLHQQAQREGFIAGVKLVRGAYMEKERERAAKLGYPSPIQPDKASCDRDFDAAVRYCVENINHFGLCMGTHNEKSTKLLASLIKEHGLKADDPRLEFAQLFGMSDHLTYNLAYHGYNVSKYLPYGPVKAVLPYLFRRAEENSSIQGQMGRELRLIEDELKRRRQQPAS